MADAADPDAPPGGWGPEVTGGRRWRLLRRFAATLTVLVLVAGSAAATTGMMLAQRVEAGLTRVPVQQLETPVTDVGEPTDIPRHFLLVGSDARDELDDEDRRELTLGDFDGQRSDTMMYVAISEDREAVSLVSLPRDLLVDSGGRQAKLTDTFAGGPDQLIEAVQTNFDLPVNHYAEVSLGGFLNVVRTLGGVEICLDEPLVDPNSGADFTDGCHDMSAEEALSYVRSRVGERADFERIDRQQRFMRSVLSELVQAQVLANPLQLFRLVDDVAGTLTTDDGLGLDQMRSVAGEVRQVITDGVPMTTVPAYPRTIDGIAYMIAYEPGARAMFEDLREGRPLADRGSREDRDETSVGLYSGGRAQALDIVAGTLQFAGFGDRAALGPGPEELDAGDTTTVYRTPGNREQAEWVGATLGAPVRDLPAGIEAPDHDVIVAIGEDALGLEGDLTVPSGPDLGGRPAG